LPFGAVAGEAVVGQEGPDAGLEELRRLCRDRLYFGRAGLRGQIPRGQREPGGQQGPDCGPDPGPRGHVGILLTEVKLRAGRQAGAIPFRRFSSVISFTKKPTGCNPWADPAENFGTSPELAPGACRLKRSPPPCVERVADGAGPRDDPLAVPLNAAGTDVG